MNGPIINRNPCAAAFSSISAAMTPQPIALPSLKKEEAAEKLNAISELFANKHAEILPGTGHLMCCQSEGRTYFGIHKTAQAHVEFSHIRSTILHILKLPPQTQVVQIIGDSAKFSPGGTAFARQYMANKLSENSTALFLWGYTAMGGGSHETLDTNGLFNEWLDSDSSRAERVLANVVHFGPRTPSDPEKIADTYTVIKNYNANVALTAKHFYLVYGKAQFGDDVESSDRITNLAFCFDGGAQSWRQIVNLLSQNIRICGLFNLRGEKNPATFVKSLNTYATFFSAGDFITQLSEALRQADKDVDEAFVNDFKNIYFKTHLLFHPDRHDAETKQPLFDAAWNKFLKEKLWNRLSNCKFERFRQ